MRICFKSTNKKLTDKYFTAFQCSVWI